MKTKNLLQVIEVVDEKVVPGHIREYLAKIVHSRYLNCQIDGNFLQKRKFAEKMSVGFRESGRKFHPEKNQAYDRLVV